MEKKPLVPYNMDSSRSKFPIKCSALFKFFNNEEQTKIVNGIISGAAINKASIELGDFRVINRKQWKSTYRDSYRKSFYVPVSNSGIASDLAKASHYRLNAV